MGEIECDFCQDLIDTFEKRITFYDDKSDYLVKLHMLESLGSFFGCGEERFCCLPLIKIMSEYGTNLSNLPGKDG